MAYNPVPTVATGDLWTASNHNTYIRDNFAAGVPAILSAKGMIAVASGSQTASGLAVGNNGEVLMAKSTEALGIKWAKFPTFGSWGNSSWNLVSKSIGTYTVNASDWTGVPSTGVDAILVQVMGKWAVASDGSIISARKKGSSDDWAIARATVGNQNHDGYGIIPLTNGQFNIVIAGANALTVLVRIYGYFPGG